MLAHGLKAEQAAPLGWKGHRTSQTRGYLVRPASVMRQEARTALRRRATLARVAGDAPELSALDVEAIAEQLLEDDSQRWWSFLIARDEDQADGLVAASPLTGESGPRLEAGSPPAQRHPVSLRAPESA
jgi:hypothetical protein